MSRRFVSRRFVSRRFVSRPVESRPVVGRPVVSGLSRRGVMLLPLATAGCGLFDNWFGDTKKPIPGTRLPVLAVSRGLQVDNPPERKIALPPPTRDPAWPQAGGLPSHSMGHLAARDVLTRAWSATIGEGGGYRAKITATPVIADGRVVAMDSDGMVSAFDPRSGGRLWRTDTQARKDRSTNIGGGIALDGGRVFCSTGRADVLALDAATGRILWRVPLGSPARAAPTVAGGLLFVPTLANEVRAFSASDGRQQWSYQGTAAETEILGLPSPAYADGVVVAGFGSGDLVALRADGGAVAWTDSLAATRGRNSLIDLPSITGLPVIDRGQVFATGLGGLTISLDLRSGRRLWEREIGSANTPWLAGDWLFLLSTDASLVAINRDDGAIAWVTPLPQYEDETNSSHPIRWLGPTLVADRLVLAGSVNRAIAVSPYTGKVLGRQDLSGAASVPPVVADGTVYLVTDDATLLALR